MSGSGTGTPAVVSSGLFTIAEARAFDKAQLASETDYPNAVITAKELEIRGWLERVCAVNFVSAAHTDEYHSGDNSGLLQLDWPRITAVTAVSTRSDSTWTLFTADELADCIPFTESGDMLYREGLWWPMGIRNIKVTYTAGYSAVPDMVKRAALRVCVTELPSTNVPFSAESYEGGGMTVSFMQGDGYNGNWHRDAEVRKAINMYSHSVGGMA